MRKGIFISVIIIVIILSISNGYLFFNKTGFSYSNISGMAISDLPGINRIPGIEKLSVIDAPTMIFIAQWIILLIILLIAFSKRNKHKKTENIKQDYNKIKNKKSKCSTDLDVLYDILRNKKKLKIEVIANTFKITKEKALVWAKILENQELAIIEYPAFGEPDLRIKEKEVQHEKEKNKEEKECTAKDKKTRKKEEASRDKKKKQNRKNIKKAKKKK